MLIMRFHRRNNLTKRHLIMLALILSIAACGITPVSEPPSDDRSSVLPRRVVDSASRAEQLRDAGVEPLSGQNIAYTMDRLEASLRRVFAGSSASVIREPGRLLIRSNLSQVISLQTGNLQPEFTPQLESIAEILPQFPSVFIEIGVHTDSAGGQRLNYRNSESQVSLIAEYLLDQNVPASHLVLHAFGESSLLVTEGSAAERAINYRVEFVFLPVTSNN